MRVQRTEWKLFGQTTVFIGMQGENEVQQLRVDVSAQLAAYPDGYFVISHKNEAGQTYLATHTELVNGELRWTMTEADTAAAGHGMAQITMYSGGREVGKTAQATTIVRPSMMAGSPPHPVENWLEEAGKTLYRADAASYSIENMQVEAHEAQQTGAELTTQNGAKMLKLYLMSGKAGERGPAGFSPYIGVNGNWYAWDEEQRMYVDTGVYSGGETPYIGENGNWFIGTNDSGISATGPRGETGPAGPEGPRGEAFTIAKVYESVAQMQAAFDTDGIAQGQFVVIETGDVNDEENAQLYIKGLYAYEYVTDLSGAQGLTGPEGPRGEQGQAGKDGVSATHSWNGTTLTVTSASGTSSANLQGPKGDTGSPGAAGYTPVRGTDYWTAADIAEIKGYVDSAILNGSW